MLAKVVKKKKSKTKAETEANAPKATVSEVSAKVKLFQAQCKKNYKASRTKYEEAFLKTIEEIEALQPNAFAGVQVSRFFTSGVLKKYCVIKDPLTPKQRQRVERLLQD